MDAASAMVLSAFQFGNKEIQDREDGIYIYSTQHPKKNILLSYNRLLVLILLILSLYFSVHIYCFSIYRFVLNSII